MKKCPVCGAECFDDMDTCFECLHSFARDSQEEKTPIEKMEEAAENSRMLNATSDVFPKKRNDTAIAENRRDMQTNAVNQRDAQNLTYNQYGEQTFATNQRDSNDCLSDQPRGQMFASNQQDLFRDSKDEQPDRPRFNNFSYSFGGHEESASDIDVQDNKTNNLSSAKPSSVKACNPHNAQNFGNCNPRNGESNNVTKCMPKEIVADGRFGDIRCTILDSDSPVKQGGIANNGAIQDNIANNDSIQFNTVNNDTNQDKAHQDVSYAEDEEGVQTWVLRLSLPADCDGVTVRLERA